MGCDCNCELLYAQLQDQINAVQQAVTPLMNGRPVIMLDDASDIASFDSNGDGSGNWAGYAYCDGQVHNGYQTKDLRDKFIVGAGLSYNVGDTGGANTITLTSATVPSNTYNVTDPGHNHMHTDPGHTHVVTDLGHTHAGSQVAHSHSGTTSTDGSHTHTPHSNPGNTFISSNNNGLFLTNAGGASEVDDTDTIEPAGAHSHTVATDSQTPAVTVNSAFTGISIQFNTTGVTNNANTTGITVADTNLGGAHENRPPYFALILVQRVS